jgi:hypothetical protein
LQTPTGSFNLLKSYFSSPTKQYSSGEQALDTAYLRANPTAQSSIASNLQGLSSNLTTQQQAATKQAQAQQEATKTAQTAMENALTSAQTGATQGIQSDLQSKAQAAMNQRASAQSALNSAISSGNLYALPQDVQNALGLNTAQSQANQLYSSVVAPILSGQDRYVSPEDLQKAEQWYGLASLGAMNTPGAYGVNSLNANNYVTNQGLSQNTLMSQLASQQQLGQLNSLAGLTGGTQNVIVDPSLVGQGANPLAGLNLNLSGLESAAQQNAASIASQSNAGINSSIGNIQDILRAGGYNPSSVGNISAQYQQVQQEAYRRQAVENMQRSLQGLLPYYGTSLQKNPDLMKQYQQEYGNYRG